MIPQSDKSKGRNRSGGGGLRKVLREEGKQAVMEPSAAASGFRKTLSHSDACWWMLTGWP